MSRKILAVILVIAVICAVAYFVLVFPAEKSNVSEITGKIEVPQAEVEIPAFEEEPEPLDLGSLI